MTLCGYDVIITKDYLVQLETFVILCFSRIKLTEQSAAHAVSTAKVQEVQGDQNSGLNGGGEISEKALSSLQGSLGDLSLDDSESSLGEPWL